MKWIKPILLTVVLAVLIILVFATHYYVKGFKNARTPKSRVATIENERLHHKIKNLLPVLNSGNFNNTTCFLVDMNIASGKNRFFIYDIKRDSVINTGLVTHGRCNSNWLDGRKYSNTFGSGCTSLGKYKIGNAYNGRFGLAYKLHGLDSTNSNAFNRYVVLHSHECVPGNEIDPYPICQSDGCPTVSPTFLKELSKIIDQSKRPVMLYIFD
jgi:hypothetical protein